MLGKKSRKNLSRAVLAGELFEPIGEQFDHFGFVALIEMICARDELVGHAVAGGLGQFLSVARKEGMLGATNDHEERRTKARCLRAHVVDFVAAILRYVGA